MVWSKLCQQRIEDADRIVVAVSPGWKLAFSGRNPRSRGAAFECRFLREMLMHEPEVFDRKVIPVVLPCATKADIPLPMKSMQSFVVDPDAPESALPARTPVARPVAPVPPVPHGTPSRTSWPGRITSPC